VWYNVAVNMTAMDAANNATMPAGLPSLFTKHHSLQTNQMSSSICTKAVGTASAV